MGGTGLVPSCTPSLGALPASPAVSRRWMIKKLTTATRIRITTPRTPPTIRPMAPPERPLIVLFPVCHLYTNETHTIHRHILHGRWVHFMSDRFQVWCPIKSNKTRGLTYVILPTSWSDPGQGCWRVRGARTERLDTVTNDATASCPY